MRVIGPTDAHLFMPGDGSVAAGAKCTSGGSHHASLVGQAADRRCVVLRLRGGPLLLM